MKKKFAVAAATAALITMSFSMTAFADDLTPATPGNAAEQKDNVYEVPDPQGNKLAPVKGSDTVDTGFLYYKDKLCYVDAEGRYEVITTGVWGGYGFKDGKLVKNDDGLHAILSVGSTSYLLKDTGEVEKASAGLSKFVEADFGRNKLYDYIVTDSGEIVKGWKKLDNGYWCYAKEDGTPVQSAWVMTTPGRWFFVDDNGLMVTPATNKAISKNVFDSTSGNITATNNDTDKLTTIKDTKAGREYVVNEAGLWLNGWVLDGTDWKFYSDVNKGWVKYGTKWVYLNSNGSYKALAAQVISGTKYAVGYDCYMITGYGKVAGGYVYANEKGVLQSGIQKINGVEYYFPDNTFISVAGNYNVDGRDFYTDATGKIVSDYWDKDGDGAWIYIKSGKQLKSAKAVIDGSTYYFEGAGKMIAAGVYKPLVDVDGVWTPGDKVATSLQGMSETAKTTALVNTVVVDNTGRQINNGWADLGNGEWAYAKDGMAYDGWLLYNGSWYYIDNGYMLTEQYVGIYYLDANGVWTATR